MGSLRNILGAALVLGSLEGKLQAEPLYNTQPTQRNQQNWDRSQQFWTNHNNALAQDSDLTRGPSPHKRSKEELRKASQESYAKALDYMKKHEFEPAYSCINVAFDDFQSTEAQRSVYSDIALQLADAYQKKNMFEEMNDVFMSILKRGKVTPMVKAHIVTNTNLYNPNDKKVVSEIMSSRDEVAIRYLREHLAQWQREKYDIVSSR